MNALPLDLDAIERRARKRGYTYGDGVELIAEVRKLRALLADTATAATGWADRADEEVHNLRKHVLYWHHKDATEPHACELCGYAWPCPAARAAGAA